MATFQLRGNLYVATRDLPSTIIIDTDCDIVTRSKHTVFGTLKWKSDSAPNSYGNRIELQQHRRLIRAERMLYMHIYGDLRDLRSGRLW